MHVATLKSVRWAWPASFKRMLSGLTSLWMILRLRRKSSAAPISAQTKRTISSVKWKEPPFMWYLCNEIQLKKMNTLLLVCGFQKNVWPIYNQIVSYFKTLEKNVPNLRQDSRRLLSQIGMIFVTLGLKILKFFITNHSFFVLILLFKIDVNYLKNYPFSIKICFIKASKSQKKKKKLKNLPKKFVNDFLLLFPQW